MMLDKMHICPTHGVPFPAGNQCPKCPRQEVAKEQIRYLGDIQRLSLRQGDTIVLSVPSAISVEMRERLREQMAERLPGYPVIVLSCGMRIGVVETTMEES